MDDFHARGMASCEGSRKRLKASRELEQKNDVIGFACGYAVGAMFAKFGLEDEVGRVLSERAARAGSRCRARMKKQGAKTPRPP
jgi:hypothetical protein